MSQPATLVIEGLEPYQIIFGANQPGVSPLHALRSADGIVISRWELSDTDRANVNAGADVFLFQYTFMNPPMPVDIQIGGFRADTEQTIHGYGLDRELMTRINKGSVYLSPDQLQEKVPGLMDQPVKFDSHEEYQRVESLLKVEWTMRPADQAEMDFEEWQLAEIMRLRKLTLHMAKNL